MSKETDCFFHFWDAGELWVWGEDLFLAQHKERCWNCGVEEKEEEVVPENFVVE